MKAIGGPTIGLLAGMGVKSTAPFLEMVIAECQRQYGASQQWEFPQMIIFSWPTEVRFDRDMDTESYGLRLAEGIRWLSSTGVDFIAVPANLPHIYWDAFAPAATVPLLNIVEIAMEIVPRDRGKVALLATRPTRDSGLYHRPLAAEGVELVATDEMQQMIDDLLAALWRGEEREASRARWVELIAAARAAGAGCALLACTDLNAVPAWNDVEIPIFDATGALASRVVSTWVEMAKR